MQKQTNQRMVKKNRKKASIALVFTLIIISLMTGFGNGSIQYAFSTISCSGKKPVEASAFMAGDEYELPNDPQYSMVNYYGRYFCTEQEALDAGFHHDPSSPGAQVAEQKQHQQEADATLFSPSKINFIAYVPTANGYSAGDLSIQDMGHGLSPVNQLFFNIKKDHSNVVGVREGVIGNEYQLCLTKEYSCSNVGTDSSGHTLTKEVVNTFKQPIISYMITIGTTFINLEGVGNDFSDADAITIFNSFTEYK